MTLHKLGYNVQLLFFAAFFFSILAIYKCLSKNLFYIFAVFVAPVFEGQGP